MIHPNTTLHSVNKEKGLGIFATSFIPKGTLTYVKDKLEIEISMDDHRLKDPLLNEIIETYTFIDENGTRILSWDNAKYVNHCCHCNTMSTGYGFEIAVSDIAPGEEITDEYGMFNSDYEMELKCSKKNCRGHVTESDIEFNYIMWDERVKSALKHFNNVDQPLLPFTDDAVIKNLRTYLSTGRGYRSVLILRYKGEQKNH
jgi:hypothetical protein